MIGVLWGRSSLVVASVFATVASAAAETANNSCPFEVGDLLSPLTGSDLDAVLSSVPLEKGDFETTQEFESRRQSALKDFIDAPVVAFTHGDPKYPDQDFTTARYDADLERVLYNRYFISNGYGDAGTALQNTEVIGQYDFYEYISFDLILEEEVVGTYAGGNALGASVEVKEIVRRTISVAQLTPSRGSGGPYFQGLISADMPHWSGDGLEPDEVLAFDLPLDVAKDEYHSLKTVVAFSLEEPYLAYNEHYIGPIITTPLDRTILSTVMIGNIYCAAVLDSKNTVLDVAAVANYD
ncbi:hypothetical protein [Rhodosalinus sediminis]|uniref:hypothetical protein n=1 Tax=Rhodosalinus sediminis TaxID=1940533 RepID=UPI0011C05AA8|nr:hypothetical protein [Rhodosalinus sediminis]